MGFTLPAAIGAQLAQPDREVLAICGDGDFLQTMQELQAAVLAGTPVCAIVLDNSGWISIKGGQETFFGRSACDRLSSRRTARSTRPDFAAIGRAFGIHAEQRRRPGRGRSGGRRALASGRPVARPRSPVERDLAVAGPDKTGWWDVPVPEYHPEQRRAQLEGRMEEQS